DYYCCSYTGIYTWVF
nr:immunoglobulin light chain junction region [Macaca mulatta]